MVKKKRILFLCHGNSARSQMAEAITRHIGARYFEAFSAGTKPAPAVHPQAIATLRKNRVSDDGLVPKDVSAFAGEAFDMVVCLCDRDREEPVAMPNADVIPWRFPDPTGSDDEHARARAFEDVFRGLERRIRLLIAVTVPHRAPEPAAVTAA